MQEAPKSILIIGSGVFGLSTALSLTTHPSFSSTHITVLDRSPFPSPDGSSIDTSRIVRSDYSDPAYASLAAAGQAIWRQNPSSPSSLGGSGRYSESGLVLVANKGEQGEKYVRGSYQNVLEMVRRSGDEGSVCELKSRAEIDAAVGTGGGSGDWGYINTRSGWADAEEGMKWLRRRVEATGRVSFVLDEATSLIFSSASASPSPSSTSNVKRKILGANLKSGSPITADLTILATGAWTPSLIDLRGRAQATGQVLCYLPLTPSEQASLARMPVLLNMSTGLFIIPPRNNILKVARHAYGLSNPTSIPHPEKPGEKITVSLPRTAKDDPNLWVPAEGERDCRKALRDMIPSLGERPFTKTKICWYTDTPKGDFLITYHPEYEGLFLATGGSGHGYKFLPVIGDKIMDCIERNCPVELQEKWAWPAESVETVVTEDGSRGGVPGLILEDELRKGSRL